MPDNVIVSVKEERMKNKKYEIQPLMLKDFLGYIDKDTGEYVVDYQKLRQSLKKELKRSYYKIQVIIDTYIDLGLMRIEGKQCFFSPLTKEGYFLSIPIETARYCIDIFSELTVKVYCWFLNKQQLHDYYGYSENVWFTQKELITDLGYNYDQPETRKKFRQCVDLLKEVGAIDCGKPKAKNGEGRGLYTELYGVNKYIKLQKESEKNFQLEEKQNKMLEEKNRYNIIKTWSADMLSSEDLKLLEKGKKLKW